MKVFHTGSLARLVKGSLMAVLLGAVSVPGFTFDAAKADANYLARQAVQGVILNIIRTIRDDLQRRTVTRPDRPLQFTGEDSASARIYDDAFAALAYNGMPTKAAKAAPVQPAQSSFLYGATATATADRDETSDGAGVTTVTRSFTATGSGDITRIGIFGASDAITLLVLGSGSWARSNGVDSKTDGVAGTMTYLNGGFSTDFTVQSQSTKSTVTIGGIGVHTDSVSFANNFQYKFDLPNAWFIEPTVGFTYTQTNTKIFDSQDGHSTEIQGGARIGTEVMWNGIRTQATFTATAFSPVSDTPTTAQTGHLGGRAVAKWVFLWSDRFSSFIEVHAKAIEGSNSQGTTGGLRWTF
jgi:Autotransporter beta-domain